MRQTAFYVRVSLTEHKWVISRERRGLVRKIKEGALQGYIITHGLAEFYSVLTRAPFSPRVHPAEAGRFLEDNILPHFELVALSPHDYKAVLSTARRQDSLAAWSSTLCTFGERRRRDATAYTL